MVVCSDPPDRAALVPTAHLEESAPARRESASWQFRREALRRGSLMTWPLFGSTDRDSIRSL
ncbi:hypothetical protein [Terrabacter carboxydivorans]|uniref:Uncharacterized protein n=1 Tax=Terrabacter carboxydivorans TaxID=619730 RepID=A0ABN3MG17_9MICO